MRDISQTLMKLLGVAATSLGCSAPLCAQGAPPMTVAPLAVVNRVGASTASPDANRAGLTPSSGASGKSAPVPVKSAAGRYESARMPTASGQSGPGMRPEPAATTTSAPLPVAPAAGQSLPKAPVPAGRSNAK